MLKFVFTQMTLPTHSRVNKSNTFIFITTKNITWGKSNKFQDPIFEINKTF